MPSSPRKIKAADATAAVELITDKALGREVASFEVFGINSLKTLEDPAQISSQVLREAELSEDRISLTFDTMRIEIDLQRAGSVVWSNEQLSVDDTAVSRRPTGRLVFCESGVLSFEEPAKTKRIGFWIKSLTQ
ncbi:hypothetical protein [Streptomyces pseudogriseolus]|uniref:hypothetical protein n=1 Tax=Streptomyces pseudogriseolus TaxID=36817 RepID=UPI00348C4000